MLGIPIRIKRTGMGGIRIRRTGMGIGTRTIVGTRITRSINKVRIITRGIGIGIGMPATIRIRI